MIFDVYEKVGTPKIIPEYVKYRDMKTGKVEMILVPLPSAMARYHIFGYIPK